MAIEAEGDCGAQRVRGLFGLILLIVLIVLASRGQQGMDQQQENRRGHLSEAPQMVGAPPETR